jgi:hypothetical protein
MIRLAPLSVAGKLTLAALVVATAAFVAQEAAGVTDTPTIPPGLVAIVAAAGLVAFLPGRWTPVAGTVAGLFNLVALFAVGAAGRLLQPGGPVAFVGGWIMVVALVVASVAGATAVWLGDRR